MKQLTISESLLYDEEIFIELGDSLKNNKNFDILLSLGITISDFKKDIRHCNEIFIPRNEMQFAFIRSGARCYKDSSNRDCFAIVETSDSFRAIVLSRTWKNVSRRYFRSSKYVGLSLQRALIHDELIKASEKDPKVKFVAHHCDGFCFNYINGNLEPISDKCHNMKPKIVNVTFKDLEENGQIVISTLENLCRLLKYLVQLESQ